jgi:filamentous hemagglutinin
MGGGGLGKGSKSSTSSAPPTGPATSCPSPAPSTGQLIANGHAYDKHVVKQQEFPEVKDRAAFGDLVDGIIKSPTSSKSLSGGRTAYWENTKGTVVIVNPKASDSGTCFRPKNGVAYFNGLK